MRCIFDIVLQSKLQHVLSRDIVKLPVDRHLVRSGLAAVGIIGIAYVVGRGQLPNAIVKHVHHCYIYHADSSCFPVLSLPTARLRWLVFDACTIL